MKKLAAIFSLLIVGLFAVAQSTPTAVTPDGWLTKAEHQYIWSATTDTLTNADTLTYVWRIKGSKTFDINMKLYSDHVSGTAGGTLIGYKSIDGVNYEASGDTITISSLSADAMDSETIDLDDFAWPYFKLIYLQTGTAVTVPKVYVYAKEN